jgi:hypothetical protein
MNIRGVAVTHPREIGEIMTKFAARGDDATLRNRAKRAGDPCGEFDMVAVGGDLFSEARMPDMKRRLNASNAQ